MSKVVLGKGLGALIPSEETAASDDKKLRMIPLDSIAPNPLQPRRDFDEDALRDLAASFERNGIMQPLVVKEEGGGYTIVAGERRYRAARLVGMDEVPAVTMTDLDDARMLELALVENLQREDLNPIEVAEAYRGLIDKCELTQGQLAERVGKSRAAVANLLRLLTLPESVKKMVRSGNLGEGHARAILALPSEEEMLRMAESIVEGSLSVRETENRTVKARKRRLVPKRKLPALAEAETKLKQTLGTSVKIVRGLKRGRIEVEFYSDDDLERLLDLFERIPAGQ